MTPGDVGLATFDHIPAVLSALTRDEMLFSIEALSHQQSWYVMAAMMQIRRSVRIITEHYNPAPGIEELLQPYHVQLKLYLFNKENAGLRLEVFARVVESQRERD